MPGPNDAATIGALQQLAAAQVALTDVLRQAVVAFGRPASIPGNPVHRDVHSASGASKLADKNPKRARIVIRALKTNKNTIEIGNTQQLVFGQGIPVEPGESYTEETNAYRGEWWAIAPSTALDADNGARVIEQLFADTE